MSRLLPMSRLLRLSFLAVLCLGMAAPALAQEKVSSDERAGFQKIDGTTLKSAALSYDATLKMGSRSRDLSSTQTFARTATDGTDTWTLVNKIQALRGTRIDSLIVGRSSLLPISRHRRGGAALDLTYFRPSASGETSISGTMKSGGQSKPISTSIDGPVLAGGVHDVIAVGAMPLRPGFEATLRVFSPQDQSAKRAEFEVTGTETVETPAGSFETYVVDLNVGEGQVTGTVFLRKKAPHYYVNYALAESRWLVAADPERHRTPTESGIQLTSSTLP